MFTLKHLTKTLVVATLLLASAAPLAQAIDRCNVGLTCVDLTWARGVWGASSLNVTAQAEHEAVGGVTGRLYVDNIEVDSCTGSSTCTTGPYTFEIPDGECAQIKATSTPPAGAPMTDTATVCATNPGFEFEDGVAGADCPPAGWDHYVFGTPGRSVCRSTADAHTGNASAKIVDTISGGSGSYAGLESPRTPIGAGEDVRARGWTKVSGDALFAYIRWFDAAGAEIAITQIANPGSSSWASFDETRTAPANTASASLLFYACTGCVTTAYVDDASIEPA